MQTFDSPNPITVTLGLSSVMANVRITASDRTDTTLDVQPTDPNRKADQRAFEQTKVEFVDGRLTVRTPKLPNLFAKSGGIDVVIALPTRSHLDGDTGMGQILCTGRFGDVRLKSGFGEIRVDEADKVVVASGAGDIAVEHTGEADISTGSGEVRLRRVTGVASVKNSNGQTWIGEVGGDVTINGANGAINVDRALAGLTAKTANGAIRLGEVVSGEISVQTAAGNLDIGVRTGSSAWLDLNTIAGHVSNELDDSSGPVDGQPTVRIHARTHVGGIAIHRATSDAS